MRWKVVSEQPLYGDEWLDVRVADVELPDGRRLDHRLIRTPPGAGVAAVDDAGRVLLIWRHRFITDSWGWEIPLGKVEEGESPIQAAAREFEEETGWRAGPLRHLIDVQPTPGISDSRHHIYVASTATQVGEPDGIESERTEWVPLSGLGSLIERGDMASGTTLAALLYLQSKIKLSGSPVCTRTAGPAESAGVRGHPLLEGARRAAGDLGDGRQHGGLIEGATGVELEERVHVLGGHAGQHLLP